MVNAQTQTVEITGEADEEVATSVATFGEAVVRQSIIGEYGKGCFKIAKYWTVCFSSRSK